MTYFIYRNELREGSIKGASPWSQDMKLTAVEEGAIGPTNQRRHYDSNGAVTIIREPARVGPTDEQLDRWHGFAVLYDRWEDETVPLRLFDQISIVKGSYRLDPEPIGFIDFDLPSEEICAGCDRLQPMDEDDYLCWSCRGVDTPDKGLL